ncbi:hypothetical protein X726_32730 [Mesorhizobium sp. L103C105A0]|nr:hypothetical protein X726_32730 [Mesorhizobium sp. L103C105A0]
MSKHAVRGGDITGLLARFAQHQNKAQARTGRHFALVCIQEAGLDGFWIHRMLEAEGIDSHVVDAASIATSRGRRRAKTDKIDGEALVRALLSYKRGEPRVCAVVRYRASRRRIIVASAVAKFWLVSGPAMSTVSRACYLPRESPATSRCGMTVDIGVRN